LPYTRERLFEWTEQDGQKKPWFISANDKRPLTFAGLYDTWHDDKTGEKIRSCTIIVTSANMFMGEIHDRMPVILEEGNWLPWLAEPRQDLLVPANENKLQAWRVSTNVNSSRYMGNDTMEPLDGE